MHGACEEPQIVSSTMHIVYYPKVNEHDLKTRKAAILGVFTIHAWRGKGVCFHPRAFYSLRGVHYRAEYGLAGVWRFRILVTPLSLLQASPRTL